MKQNYVRLLLGALIAFAAGAWGCSGVDQITEADLREFRTLTVSYGDPGSDPSPCNDVLPQIDGLAQDQEWNTAEPLFLRMTPENGSGGNNDFTLELRAIWTDEGDRVSGTNRIYFLVRYPDDDQNNNPDLLAYGTEVPPGSGNVVATRPPFIDPNSPDCDPIIIDPSAWSRLNPNGREDQVVMMFTEMPDSETPSDLVELNRQVLAVVGPDTPAPTPISSQRLTDVWVWRAGRTNLHPVPQFANWTSVDEQGMPEFTFSRFVNTSGFAEDLVIDGSTLTKDSGISPFVKNFRNRDPAPDRINECPPMGRPDDEEAQAARNRGLANDLALWWPTSVTFRECNVLACSRTGQAQVWSTRLLPGDFDKVRGWGLRVPSESSRDVRAKGTYEATQEKGFAVHTIEFMREFNTGNPDDLVIRPTGDGQLRMVIGVLDASGRVGSGSFEVRLRFEAPKPRVGAVRRC